jgi:hypothetical protein
MDFWHRELLLRELKFIISEGGSISRAKIIQEQLKERPE